MKKKQLTHNRGCCTRGIYGKLRAGGWTTPDPLREVQERLYRGDNSRTETCILRSVRKMRRGKHFSQRELHGG